MVTDVAVRFIVAIKLASYFGQSPIWITNRTAVLVPQNVLDIVNMQPSHEMNMLLSPKWSQLDVHVVYSQKAKLDHKDIPQAHL